MGKKPAKQRVRAGRTVRSVRWTLEVASAEFGIARNTLSKRLKSSGVLPGRDKKFSTSDICKAVFGDLELARAALAVSQKENYDLKNAKLAGTLADAALFQLVSDGVILLLRQKISEANIPDDTKTEVLRDIQCIKVDEILADKNSPADDSDLDE